MLARQPHGSAEVVRWPQASRRGIMSEPTRPPAPADVRMRGFAVRATVDDAQRWVGDHAAPLSAETVSLDQAAGRVLASDVLCPLDVPSFDRAMMDGFALRGADTLGASPYNPLPLAIVGRALPGHPFPGSVSAGEAVRIMTGAPLPPGADAVLPAEEAEIHGQHVHALGEVPPGKHVGRRGEDVTAGSILLRAGRCLRPQDIGVVASVGLGEVMVHRRPVVRIVVTGDELLRAGTPHQPYRIYDANGPMLQALVARDGGIPRYEGITPDRPEAIAPLLRDADADVVLVSGGSSVGEEDHAPLLVAEMGTLAVHGIAMRPSSPTGLGLVDGRLVFLLPGNPVSCLCAYDFFAGWAIRRLGGRSPDWPYLRTRLPLARKLVSQVGRVDYARVAIVGQALEPLSVGGASVLSSTTRADGFVIIPADSEGYPAGAEVEVFLYDRLVS
jgi:molybdopterin molybdotransferase